jgi:hypothetical protein
MPAPLHRLPEPRTRARDREAEGPEAPEALAAEVVTVVQKVRRLDLKKAPSISETLDWARALALLNVETLGDEAVRDTLTAIFKYEADIRKAEKELREHVAPQRTRPTGGAAGEPSGGAGGSGDVLH